MLFFLPILPFIPLFLLASAGGTDRRRSFLIAATAWGLILTAITEILSLFREITAVGLGVAWVLVLAAVSVVWSIRRRADPPPRKRRAAPRRGVPAESATLIAIGALVAMAGLVALVAPPNNYDSMTYHMARVAHWAQDRSIAHFPTHLPRQLHQNPWAEFAVLHLLVMAGGDRFANLVQWFAMAGSIAGVSLIAQQMGARRRGQVLAAALCAALPMGVLQASTTQNDYVLSFWLVCFVSFQLSAMAEGGDRLAHLLAAGGALGLGVLTKGTAYLFALPFAIWLGLSLIGRRRWQAAGPILAVAAIALAPNLGHYARNQGLYGTPIGPGGEESGKYRYANEVFGPRAFASNLLRNLALETAVPIRALDRAEESAVRGVHRWIGADPDDPRTTFTEQKFAVRGNFWNSENVASNPLHLALLVGSLIALWSARWPERRRAAGYGAALVGGFLLFCFYLRWQPWHCRLHLPLFVLGSVLVALVMERTLPARRSLATSGLLLVLAGWVTAHALGRPMVGPSSIFAMRRNDQYFTSSPGARPVYNRLADGVALRGRNNIGLVMDVNDYEYPLWVLVKQRNPRARIEHVQVENVSRRRAEVPPWSSFKPDLVIHINGRRGEARIVDVAQDPGPGGEGLPRQQ